MATLVVFLVFMLCFSSALAYNCTDTCDCDMEDRPELASRPVYVLRCQTSDLEEIGNSSLTDVFIYDSDSFLDTNILVSFYSLKALFVHGKLASIASLPPLPNLKQLLVRGSHLSYLSSGILAGSAENLKNISLSKNNIEFISKSSFVHLKNVENIDLSSNNLDSLSASLFEGMNNLKYLNLSYNQIGTLPADIFIPLSKLLFLDIQNNSMYQIETFKFMSRRVNLNLAENAIKTIKWKEKADMPGILESITFSHGVMSELRPESFVNLEINRLLISNFNNVKFIDRNVFVNVTIGELAIIDNPKLVYIDALTFNKNSIINTLNISNNPLAWLPDLWGATPGLEEIIVLNMSVGCDCNLNWLYKDENSFRVTFNTSSPPCLAKPRCPPSFVYTSNSLISAEEGSQIILRCKVAGIPYPSVNWYYNERMISSDQQTIIMDTDLKIIRARSSSKGAFRCQAQNTEGTINYRFNVTVNEDHSKIIILKTGAHSVEFTWRLEKASRQYQAIIINVEYNNMSYIAIPGVMRSRHLQSMIVENLQSESTYRVCISLADEKTPDSDKCVTVTTLDKDEKVKSSGITDYSLFGIIIASIVTVLILSLTICICMASRSYAKRKKQQKMNGMVSESSYGLMTTSFSQRSALSTMFDNPGANVATPTTMSASSSSYSMHRFKRAVSEPLIINSGKTTDQIVEETEQPDEESEH